MQDGALIIGEGVGAGVDVASVVEILGYLNRVPEELARLFAEIVEEFGLRAVEPPPPLELVTEDDVGVVCWMVVLPDSTTGRR